MNGAMLTFDGIASLFGQAAVTEDYVEFRTDTVLSNAELNDLHRATIEIAGKAEGVLVERTDLAGEIVNGRAARAALTVTLRRGLLSNQADAPAQ
ncbi:hypothetical protein [Paracoccus sp. 228]|jgi:hypothetical protein|uniref:hypothetical protein n=1 Tax=Paracoccus sp. 228 TaxID=1192054 RepID=UPI0005EA5B42|nr:hypothetical protein [Paracoccus sp. 228]KIX18030.1 hypothetical protein SY26_06580 [Paracoccus sp. 228]|tara:strand:+ start:401 stop:685 length:285 start_codon:yes stop_codon:yes gene_type:complete